MQTSKGKGEEMSRDRDGYAYYSGSNLILNMFKNSPYKEIDYRHKLLSRYTNKLYLENRVEELKEYHAYCRLLDKLNRARYHQMMSNIRYYGPIGSAKEVSTRMIIKAGRHCAGEVYNPCEELLIAKNEWAKSVTQLAVYAEEDYRNVIKQYETHNSVIVSAAMWLKTIGYEDYEVLCILEGRFTIDAEILKSYYRFGYVAYGVDGCVYVAKCNFKTKDNKAVYGLVLEVFKDDYTEVLIPLLSSYNI